MVVLLDSSKWKNVLCVYCGTHPISCIELLAHSWRQLSWVHYSSSCNYAVVHFLMAALVEQAINCVWSRTNILHPSYSLVLSSFYYVSCQRSEQGCEQCSIWLSYLSHGVIEFRYRGSVRKINNPFHVMMTLGIPNSTLESWQKYLLRKRLSDRLWTFINPQPTQKDVSQAKPALYAWILDNC